MEEGKSFSHHVPRLAGYFLSPLIIAVFFLPAEVEIVPVTIWKTTGVILLMMTLWLTEVIPVYVTGLIPVVLFPVLGLMPLKEVSASYSHPVIFLFFGGFLIARAIEKYNLHVRLAYKILSLFGYRNLLSGVFFTAAFLSMWISNTATAIILIPIIKFLLETIEKTAKLDSQSKHRLEILLLLFTAYGCNIGGMGTIIGTPPNVLLAAFVKERYQITITFFDWAILGIPFVVFLVVTTYYFLKNAVFPLPSLGTITANEAIYRKTEWSNEEKLTITVFLFTVLLWFLQPFLQKFYPFLDDSVIAMVGALALFFIPVDLIKGRFLLAWDDVLALKNAFGILILFGGGLALAKLIQEKGLADYIKEKTQFLGYLREIQAPEIVILFLVVFFITFFLIFLTEVTSNTAITAIFLPILAPVLESLFDKPYLLLVTVPLSASSAFMLPIATPPNAIIFSTGRITIREMAKSGFYVNILYTFLITFAVIFLYMAGK